MNELMAAGWIVMKRGSAAHFTFLQTTDIIVCTCQRLRTIDADIATLHVHDLTLTLEMKGWCLSYRWAKELPGQRLQF